LNYEECRANLAALMQRARAGPENRNEATTRLQLIDELLFECLGWSKNDCVVEEPHGPTYADYTLSTTRRVLIVEAKREGVSFELPAGDNRREYALTQLRRDYPALKSALDQVANYCQSRGVPIGVVSNGHQLVAFMASRGDGVPPQEGRALLYPSLDEMLSDFPTLWDCLSYPGLLEGRLEARLLGVGRSPLPPKLSSSIPGYPGLKGRNAFQTDLQILSELVLEDLMRGRELENEFLTSCYCRSGALSKYALISKDILKTRYASLFDAERPGPTLVPAETRDGISVEIVAESLARRPILLIGDVGVGKTTFIRHLVRIEAKDVFENAISLYIDLGSHASLAPNLREFVLAEISRQLLVDHNVDISERHFVLGVYNKNIERFRAGIYGSLRQSNPTKYQEKELEHLESLIGATDQHLKAALDHLSKARRKQVVAFIDNADQRADELQQEVFLMAQEMAASWPTTVFLALRPETFHRSLRRGALSGYHPKAFTISPPRLDRVIEKRLDFGLRLASGEIPISALPKDTKARFRSLEAIMRAFQESLARDTGLNEAIENIASGNVRRALDFVKQFFGSGHVDTQKIVGIYQESGAYLVPVHEFLRALIFGDGEHYDPTRSPVANVFDLVTRDGKTHFLAPILLGSLIALAKSANTGFVETPRVYAALQNWGFTPSQIDAGLSRAYAAGLVETATRREPEPPATIAETVRISALGSYHLQRLVCYFVYVDAMIVDTPIMSETARASIGDAREITERISRVERFLEYLDGEWVSVAGAGDVFNWPRVSNALRRDIEGIRKRLDR
jgi:hypothetical protein